MGLPELIFSYRAAAEQVVARSRQGVAALLLQDAGLTAGVYTVAQEADIPSELGADNADYVKRCLVGAATRPRKVYLSVVDAEGTADTALEQLTPLDYDYVAGFPDADAADAKALADAVIAKRKGNYIGKAVVANHTADNVGVINFTTSGIKAAAGTYSGISHQYYQPTEKSTTAYLESIDQAVKNGAKVIVTPGFLFEEPVYIAQDQYPDVTMKIGRAHV